MDIASYGGKQLLYQLKIHEQVFMYFVGILTHRLKLLQVVE
ncbi:hypothetical protein [Fischerella thermalis]|nr:hypothetical protein [Fischerella thermalis]